MKRIVWLSALVVSVSCLSAESRAAMIQGFEAKFGKPKKDGTITVTIIDISAGAFQNISVTVPISKDMTAEQKTFAIFSALFNAYKTAQKDQNNPAALRGWVFDIPKTAQNTFTVTNIPKAIGKMGVNINFTISKDSTKELKTGIKKLAGAPDNRGVLQFASTRFDPNDDGSPALFQAGVDFNGVEYSSEVSASTLGGNTSGQNIAEYLYQRLFPQVSSFATIQDPALTGSNSLVVDLLPSVSLDAEFGVSFGTTSPTDGVIGELQVTPEPASLTLASTAGALALGWF
jgi:hypothetical protein